MHGPKMRYSFIVNLKPLNPCVHLSTITTKDKVTTLRPQTVFTGCIRILEEKEKISLFSIHRWLLQIKGSVFTVRCELNYYIQFKVILVFKGLVES